MTLIDRLKKLVAEERKVTAEIISLLEEVQSRKIFAAQGYSSLFDFCVKELGYSESAAQRRIAAMRLTRDVPEVRVALESGTLTLSSVAKVQTFSRQQHIKDAGKKRELLNAVQGKSARETDRYLASIAPQPIPQESQRVLTAEMTELKFAVDEETLAMLKKIRELWAHQNSNFTQAELIKKMAQFVISKTNPAKKVQKPGQPITRLAQSVATSAVNVSSRYIPAQVRREIWRRDEGKCQHVGLGRKFESGFMLEIDHITPFVFEGSSTDPKNLRLLCRTHNQLRTFTSGGGSEFKS